MPLTDPSPIWREHKIPSVWAQLKNGLDGVCTMLADEESRETFTLVRKFWGAFETLPMPRRNPKCTHHYGYSEPGCNPKGGDLIVDCGAFIGDTFREYGLHTGYNCKIIAIEPHRPNVAYIRETHRADIERGVIDLRAAAIGASNGSVSIVAESDSRAMVVPGSAIPSITLDEILKDKKVGYIKIDVEGADLDALKGGELVIRRDRPTMAVCGYHKPSHMVDIATTLLEFLHPCRLYAGTDPDWGFHIHYIAAPD